jgi:hypothetical protein
MSPTCDAKKLAARLRGLFQASPNRWFTVAALSEAAGCSTEQARRTLCRAYTRGELIRRYETDSMNHEIVKYLYAAGYQRGRIHPVRGMLIKAIYVTETFTVHDIARLTSVDRSYVNRTVLALRKTGHLATVGRRYKPGAHNPAPVYHVVDRDRFRKEVIG